MECSGRNVRGPTPGFRSIVMTLTGAPVAERSIGRCTKRRRQRPVDAQILEVEPTTAPGFTPGPCRE